MSDTIRTRAQILALLADNENGDISPQDLRDAIISMFGVYGAIYSKDNAVTQVLAAATAAKLLNFTKNGLGVGSTPDYQNGQITLDNGGAYIVLSQISAKSSAADATIKGHLRLDAVEADGGFHHTLTTADKLDSGMCVDLISANAAQVLSLYVESDKTTALTAEQVQIIALRIG